jgi:hypothetical protein
MGGRIMIHSDGPELGTVARIWLPGVILTDEAQPSPSQAPLSESKRIPKTVMAV